MDMNPAEKEELRQAKRILENPGLVSKMTNLLGTPVEKGLALLPSGWQDSIGSATQSALMKGLVGATKTMSSGQQEASPWWHKLAVAATGGAGGFFGLPALIIELPISTAIMLRSIADIARANGESVDAADTRLACLEVFALGGPSKSDDASETGYFAVRTALAKAVTEAAECIAERGIVEEGAPALLRFIIQVAARFQVQVTEKAAAQAVPVVGALAGGTINLLFIDHFQDMSRGHFTVRRLERKYSPELVRLTYQSL